MTEKKDNSLSLNKECKEFYDVNYDNRYEILRNQTQLKFLDYKLLQVIRTFNIKDKFLNQNINKNFFLTPEEYDITTVLTHNLQIYLNGIKMDVMESDNKDLEKLKNCHRIEQTNEYIEKIETAMSQLDDDKSELNWSFKRIYSKFEKKHVFMKYKNILIEYLRINFPDYLISSRRGDITEKEKYDTLNELNERRHEVIIYVKKMLRCIKIRKHVIAEKIIRLTKSLKKLIAIPHLELIALDLPKYFYNFSKNIKYFPFEENHFTLEILTEESYPRFTEYKNDSWFKSIFCGESIFYIIYCYIYDTSSTYFDITPPENTRIKSVKRDKSREPKCNFMMETEKSKINEKNKVKFERGFNERLVIHINKPKTHPNFGYMFSVRFQPYKTLQRWIVISFILSILYIAFISYLFGLLFFIEVSSPLLSTLIDMIELAKFQAPWVYGLIIGNQLWLQKPKFLWRKSTILAISLIIGGILVLVLSVYMSSVISNTL